MSAAFYSVHSLKAMLASGAPVPDHLDLSARNLYGQTLLNQAAACAGAARVVSALLGASASLSVDALGHNALHLACSSGDLECVELLIPVFPIDARSRCGRSALCYAARRPSPEMVSALLGAGANARSCDLQGWTPLMWAALSRSERTICLLLADSDLAAVNANGHTALDIARASRVSAQSPAALASCESIELLLSLGASERPLGRSAENAL